MQCLWSYFNLTCHELHGNIIAITLVFSSIPIVRVTGWNGGTVRMVTYVIYSQVENFAHFSIWFVFKLSNNRDNYSFYRAIF